MYWQSEKSWQQYVLHISTQYGKLRPTNGWDRFRSLAHHILPSLLQRRRSSEANQTLHDVWPSLGLVHYVYILGGSCPLMEFCLVQNSASAKLCGVVKGMELRNFRRGCHLYSKRKTCILLYWQHYCTALQQRASAKLCRVVKGMELRNFRRGRHLYSKRKTENTGFNYSSLVINYVQK